MEAAEGSLPLRALYRTVATAIWETPLTCPLSRNAHSASIFAQSLLRLGCWKQNEHRLPVLADPPQRITMDRQFVLWKHPSGYSTLGLSMSELSFYSRSSTGIAASSSESREPGNPSILLLVHGMDSRFPTCWRDRLRPIWNPCIVGQTTSNCRPPRKSSVF